MSPLTKPLLHNALPVCRAHELEMQATEQAWLIEALWGQQAVGIVGGAPKCAKSWLGLDMALSVASNTPCLGHFAVSTPGPTLVFLAEDALSSVRARIEALCTHRGLDVRDLDLHVITAPVLRLDLQADQQALRATLDRLRPRLLVLDPLVRLHRLDENSASDISRLLGFLRELQRSFHCAIVLVHHAAKKQRAVPGQALRGSSDLHAFGDSNAYLTRRREQLLLTLEHRSAPSPEPLPLALVSRPDGSATHLEMAAGAEQSGLPLDQRVLARVRTSARALTRAALREQLKVNNQRLGEALATLVKQGLIQRIPEGYCTAQADAKYPPPLRPAPRPASLNEPPQCTLPL